MSRIVATLLLSTGLMFLPPQGNPSAFAADEPVTEAKAETETEDGEEEPKSMFARQGSIIEEKPAGVHQPWSLLRSIQRLQDNMAIGDRNAAKAYRVLLIHSANWMRQLDDSAWQFERNLDAVAVYLLIGGDVELGYKALQKSRLPRQHKMLLSGAVAYSERDVGTAYAIMSQIDHMSLPPSIAGQVALAKAMVFSSSDLEKAMQYLQQARLLAVGTLIEEAALRRSIRIAAELNDMKQLRYFARTYLHRFPKSHYFTDYLRNVSYGLVKLSNSSGGDVLADFKHLVKKTSLEHQVNVTQYVARKAVLTGRYRLADWAADYAFARVAKDSKFHTRLKLYSAAGKVMDPEQTEDTAKLIEELDSGHLAKFDKKIFEAVKILSDQILRDPLENQMSLSDEDYPLAAPTEDAESIMNSKAGENGESEVVASLQSDRLKKLTSQMNEILEQRRQ